MQRVLVATNNQGKFKEILEAIGAAPFQFLSLKDVGLTAEPEENGDSYAENAKIKAEFFFKLAGLPTIADDSGIEVTSLKDELGIHTRRWGAGAEADDKEWLEYFLTRMENESDRSAKFICYLAATGFEPKKDTLLFEGVCLGNLLFRPASHIEPGIPLSSVFLPLGAKKVFSALTPDKKNIISHRGQAAQKLKEYLLSLR